MWPAEPACAPRQGTESSACVARAASAASRRLCPCGPPEAESRVPSSFPGGWVWPWPGGALPKGPLWGLASQQAGLGPKPREWRPQLGVPGVLGIEARRCEGPRRAERTVPAPQPPAFAGGSARTPPLQSSEGQQHTRAPRPTPRRGAQDSGRRAGGLGRGRRGRTQPPLC